MPSFTNLLPDRFLEHWLSGIISLIFGVLSARLIASLARAAMTRRLGANAGVMSHRLVWYPLLILVIVTVLGHLGFDVSVVLGAAGILTIAIGFAAQTSAANVISGVFLLGEHPFDIGDVIRVGETTGTVSAVDLFSVKLCTFDNLMVRIPNELLLKSEITNLSFYPLRRIDIPIRVAYSVSSRKINEILMEVAAANHECLDEPAPLFMFTDFGTSGQQITFGVWVESDNFLRLRNDVRAQIKDAFDAAGIRFAYEQMVIHTPESTALNSQGPTTP